MEALFANAEVLARWDEWNFNIAVDRLSLFEGEGESEGLSRARWSQTGLTPHLYPDPSARSERRSEPQIVCLPRRPNVRGALLRNENCRDC
jgi:hypothetical protein